MDLDRFFLPQLFGSSVQVKIIEILLKNYIEERKSEEINWENFSDIARLAGVAKSSSKRILDDLIRKGFVEEKKVSTHAQNPPRLIRLNLAHPAIGDLVFFYRKVRGSL